MIDMGDVSPCGSPCHQPMASGTRRRWGDPNALESGLHCPEPRSGALQRSYWDQDGRRVLAPPGPRVAVTSAPAAVRSHVPPSASLGKSSDMTGTDPVAKPPGCMGTRVGATGPTPPISGRQSSKSAPTVRACLTTLSF